jgi:hypothetical protein
MAFFCNKKIRWIIELRFDLFGQLHRSNQYRAGWGRSVGFKLPDSNIIIVGIGFIF